MECDLFEVWRLGDFVLCIAYFCLEFFHNTRKQKIVVLEHGGCAKSLPAPWPVWRLCLSGALLFHWVAHEY